MVLLDSDATKGDCGVIICVGCLTANLGNWICRQVHKDLAVKNTILIEVHQLRSTTDFGGFNLRFLCIIFRIACVLLSKLLFKRLLHLFHLKLVLSHAFLSFCERSRGIRVASGSSSTTTSKLGSELGILFLELTD